MKVRLALAYDRASTSEPLFTAMMEELVEHSFTIITTGSGEITRVQGSPVSTLGYEEEDLVGKNVSMLCPPSVSSLHGAFMKNYKGPTKSKIIQKVRNLEARHQNGETIPICLEVVELTSDPLMFSGKVTEVEGSTEALICVEGNGTIKSLSEQTSRTLFGYDHMELIGKHVSVLAPNVSLKEGSQVVACQHKDGSNFFVSVETSSVSKDLYNGIIRRVLTAKPKRPKSVTEDYIYSGDLLGWYEITKSLGSGYFGTVKMATHRLTGLNVAVKTLKRKQYKEAGMIYPPREIELIRKLNHPNICRLYDTIITDEAIYMITEVVPGGELFDYVSQKDHLGEDESRNIMRQLVKATEYMHRSGIVHRDLKMENILLNSDGTVKIIDMGLGNFFDATGKHKLNTFCGSADYAAPELWKGLKYHGPEVDIWSLGVVLFVITTGFIPFNDSTHVMQIRYHWPKSRKFSESLKGLVDLIFQPSSLRCSMKDIINHPWLNDGGKLETIKLHPLKSSVLDLDEDILNQMEGLGFGKKDVENAIEGDAHNQLTTTYYLLEHQAELKGESRNIVKRRRASSEHVGTSSTPKITRSASDKSHCIIC